MLKYLYYNLQLTSTAILFTVSDKILPEYDSLLKNLGLTNENDTMKPHVQALRKIMLKSQRYDILHQRHDILLKRHIKVTKESVSAEFDFVFLKVRNGRW